ncbi:hypothetical protein CO051_00680, partial [Candidatus Roizmanbacteria bacterium CG_4_9_14_0_2_um_filter_39_13]
MKFLFRCRQIIRLQKIKSLTGVVICIILALVLIIYSKSDYFQEKNYSKKYTFNDLIFSGKENASYKDFEMILLKLVTRPSVSMTMDLQGLDISDGL